MPRGVRGCCHGESTARTAFSTSTKAATEAPVRAHYGERGDVAVLNTVGGLFFHLGMDGLNDHNGIIHHNTNGQYQGKEGN